MNSKKMKLYSLPITILFTLFSSAASAERLSVSVSEADIHSGPSKNYDILWKVEKYHPLFIVEKSESWYHFRDFEGDEGWIHKSLLNNISSIITNKVKCNVRAGPGIGYKILFSVGKGIPFKIIKRKGGWIHIKHADGDKGWIHKSLVW